MVSTDELLRDSAAKRRCLQVIIDYPDLAHASRRLHLSQAELMRVLALLQDELGPDQITLHDGRIEVAEALRQRLR